MKLLKSRFFDHLASVAKRSLGGRLEKTTAAGLRVGMTAGLRVGTAVGLRVGTTNGLRVGTAAGLRLGKAAGLRVGTAALLGLCKGSSWLLEAVGSRRSQSFSRNGSSAKSPSSSLLSASSYSSPRCWLSSWWKEDKLSSSWFDPAQFLR